MPSDPAPGPSGSGSSIRFGPLTMTDRLDDSAPFDDDQGTRIARDRDHATGAGAEASEGIHGAPDGRHTKRERSDESALQDRQTGNDGERRGSEPLTESDQHRSHYGGGGSGA